MATLNPGMICIKYAIFTMNFIFLLMGIVVLTTGAALWTIFNSFESFLESHHYKPAEIFIAIGAIIFFVSFIGMIGAIKESTLLINLYTFLMLLLFILEIAAGITAFAMRCDVFDDIKSNMFEALPEYNTKLVAKDTWDFVQKKMNCCGVDQPLDWKKIHVSEGEWFHISGAYVRVPFSCCSYSNQVCAFINENGCYKQMERYVSDSASALGYVAIVVSVIQLIGMIISLALVKGIRRAKTLQEMERQHRIYNLSNPPFTNS